MSALLGIGEGGSLGGFCRCVVVLPLLAQVVLGSGNVLGQGWQVLLVPDLQDSEP